MGDFMRILVAEHDVVTGQVLESRLKQWGHDVVVVTDGVAATQHLQNEECAEVILLDWMMPEIDGTEAVCTVRALDPSQFRYIITLVAASDQEGLVAGLQAGADDCIRKPVDPRELQARLKKAGRIIELQAQLSKAREASQYQATHDSLTGLWNHVSIMGFLERELARGSRLEDPVAVILADIDRFKEINEKYGHQVGDAVLEQMSLRLRNCVRSYDAVGRFGGEEFLMVLSDCNEKSAGEFANRVRQTIESANFSVDGRALSVTISLGVVVWPARGDVDPGELVDAADESLSSAKLAGRNRVEVMTFMNEGSGSHARKSLMNDGDNLVLK
jgi:diguanylate cyclase (GGDEF)-like protein